MRKIPAEDPHILTNNAKPDAESHAQSVPLIRYTPLVNHNAVKEYAHLLY